MALHSVDGPGGSGAEGASTSMRMRAGPADLIGADDAVDGSADATGDSERSQPSMRPRRVPVPAGITSKSGVKDGVHELKEHVNAQAALMSDAGFRLERFAGWRRCHGFDFIPPMSPCQFTGAVVGKAAGRTADASLVNWSTAAPTSVVPSGTPRGDTGVMELATWATGSAGGIPNSAPICYTRR